MPPANRRRAIAEAILPLLVEKGSTLTSREMAEAAGIAEGTIFSVFPDKPAVIVEAVRVTMDPEPVRRAIADIPTTAPLTQQLEAIVVILFERSERVGALIGVLRSMHPDITAKPASARRYIAVSNAAILSALTELLEHQGDALRVEPSRAAAALLGFVFANAHPLMAANEKPDATEIVDIVLNGIAAPSRGVAS